MYEVDKNAKYELHFAPSFYDDIKENSKKNNDVAIKVDPSQYEDNIDEAKDVMKKYVDAVYLNGESSGGGTNLSATDNKSQVVALADDKKSSDNSAEFTNDAKADKESLSRNLQNHSEKASITTNLLIQNLEHSQMLTSKQMLREQKLVTR